MKLLKSKKLILVLSIFLISVITISVGVDLTFNKPTKLNKIVAAKRYKTSGTPVNTAFSDQNFYNCVVDAYNEEKGTSVAYTVNLTDEQLSTIKRLDCSLSEIENTLGLEKFANLEELSLAGNELTELDISNNLNLEFVYAYSNKISSLTIGENTKLRVLQIYENNLTELDVTGASLLHSMRVENNELTELNLNSNLRELVASHNKLTELNLNQNTLLKMIDIRDNLLNNIIFPENNVLEKIYLSDNLLTTLNVSNFSNLNYLSISNNDLINIKINDNSNLENIYIGNNNLIDVEISNNSKLKLINSFDGNKIEKLLLNNNPTLESVLVENAENLKQINVNGNTSLTTLRLWNSVMLENIDIKTNINLNSLSITYSHLKNIDLSNNQQLTAIDLSNNQQLTAIDLSNNQQLTSIYLNNSNMKNLDVSNNTELINLSAYENQLSNIDVSSNLKLKNLDLRKNNIENIDLNNNIELESFYVSSNVLKNLDLYNNKNLLKTLDIGNNAYVKPLFLYMGEQVDLNIDNGLIKFNENFILKLLSFEILKNQNVQIENNVATFVTSGNYTISVNYLHTSKSNYSGSYSGTYNVYVIEATSDKYGINSEEGYIYTKADTDSETILSNINLNYGKATIEDNKLVIKYENEVIKEFDIVNISSDKYDLTKDYIFKYEENSITTNNVTLNKNTENNTLEIKYGQDILQTYKLVDVNSEEYDLSNSTIKVQDNNIDDFLEKINCINCDAKIYDGFKYITEGNFTEKNTLRIIYGEDILKEYNLTFSVSGITLNKDSVRLGLENKNTVQLEATINPTNAENKNINWSSSNEEVAIVDQNGLVTSKGLGKTTITATTEDGGFTDTVEIEVIDIITYQITYKDGNNTYIEEYEENESVELKNDLTKEGYTLIGWKLNDKEYKSTDEFIMPAEDITLEANWELIIPDIEKTSEYKVKENIITGIVSGTTIGDLELGLDDIYEVKIYKKNEEEKTEDDIATSNIATSDIVKIYLGDVLVSKYTLVVLGDTSGDGRLTVSDLVKINNHIISEDKKLEDVYSLAADYDSNGRVTVSDIVKINNKILGGN